MDTDVHSQFKAASVIQSAIDKYDALTHMRLVLYRDFAALLRDEIAAALLESAHAPRPLTSSHIAMKTAREIMAEGRRDLKESPLNSVAFGNAEGRIEAAHRIIDRLAEK